MTGEEIAARARALVGVRFRPQGRSAAAGLDCVGLAALALGLGGVRGGYALRGGSLEKLEGELGAAGLVRVEGARPGDLLVMRAGVEQIHLAIACEDGIVHADAGLRRVVERPGVPPWPVITLWRLAALEEDS